MVFASFFFFDVCAKAEAHLRGEKGGERRKKNLVRRAVALLRAACTLQTGCKRRLEKRQSE